LDRSVESTRFIVTEMSTGSDHDPGVAPEETFSAARILTITSAKSPTSPLIFTMAVEGDRKSRAKIQDAKNPALSRLCRRPA